MFYHLPKSYYILILYTYLFYFMCNGWSTLHGKVSVVIVWINIQMPFKCLVESFWLLLLGIKYVNVYMSVTTTDDKNDRKTGSQMTKMTG